MLMNIKLSCISQHKEPTLSIADNTYVAYEGQSHKRRAISVDVTAYVPAVATGTVTLTRPQ